MKPLLHVVRKYGLQIGILIAIVIVLSVLAPTFAGPSALYATSERFVLLGIATAGIAVTMIASELDMSVGSMAVLSGVIAVQLSGLGLVLSILIATVTGLVLGLIQGWVISKLNINSLVFTVGTLILLSGVAWLVAGGAPVKVADYHTTDPLLVRIGVFSPPSIIAFGVLIAVGIFLAWSKWGREVYAIGGARGEATAAGVPVRRTMCLAFGISGACGALAGALTTMKGGSVTPDSYGGLLLSCVAAALVGGISLYGGRGDMINIVLGILIIAVLSAGLSAMGLQSFVSELITGVLLLVVIIVEFVLIRLSRRRRLQAMRVDVAEPVAPVPAVATV